MNMTRTVRISKYLSKHLRHSPEQLGLTLAPGGWVSVERLLAACQKARFPISLMELEEVVATNDKQRFSFSEDKSKIRANQGHSTEVDLELSPAVPPAVLYHGTGAGSVAAIREEGLKKGRRHHVHLSVDTETAQRVGARHGRPHVFMVDAAQLHADGAVFYVSDNGVWLTESVPAPYLRDLP